MTKNLRSPASLSRAEKRHFRDLVASLITAGIDPGARRDLIADFVRFDERIAGLRTEEQRASGPAKVAASRAVNVASVERRRLHAALFAGGQKLSDGQRTVTAPVGKTSGPSAADEAWRDHLHREKRGFSVPAHPWGQADREEYAAREGQLVAKYGSPTWAAMLHPTHHDQLETERIIAAQRRGNHAEAGR